MSINLQSISLTSAFNSIVAFFRSQDNSQQVKALSQGGEGTFLIRMLANIFSTLSYRIVAQCREIFLSTASLTSSNIGLSVNLGYSAFRGSNLKRRIRITPNGNYTLPKLSLIGSFTDTYGIYTLDHVELEEGKTTEIDTVVGQIKEESFLAGTSDIKIFTLFTTGISEDYVLYEGSQELPTTKVIKEMTEDKFLVRTNPYSSIDIMYLNTFPGAKYVYGTDTEFTIRYIELANVGNAVYTDAMFSYGTLKDYYNISTYLPFESVESMKVNAPLDHETQNLIRSKQDYANRMREIVPTVHDSSYYPITPTYTQITYLKDDFTLLTDNEKYKVQELLKKENFFGTPLPDIVPPRREVAHLDIRIALANKYKNISDINLDVDNIFAYKHLCRYANEDEKQKLFKKIKENGYKWDNVTKVLYKIVEPRFKIGDIIKDKCNLKWKVINENSHYYEISLVLTGTSKLLEIKAQDDYELVPDKFDINTLRAFDKVLMRSSNAREWIATFYSHYNNNKFYGCGMCCNQCIPYEENKHLLGTTEDCKDFFKIWQNE